MTARKIWRRFLAFHRLSLQAVCQESEGKGPYEGYHDYPDSELGEPAHFYLHTCKRCGGRFYI